MSQNFDGIGDGVSGFTVQSAPPDTNGAVGPNHYVDMVNSDIAIYSKIGTLLHGPVASNGLWSGFGGGCQTNNDGDGTVVYDPIADRFIISQFSVSTPPYLECIAVSQTPDPTGNYYRYSFSYADFPDYPKMGVWPDAYYETYNMFTPSGTAFVGGEACAFDRTKMLAGQAATQQCFNVGTNYGGLLPSSLDGSRLPPAGSPDYIVSLGATDGTLASWNFHVDWSNSANTTLSGPTTLTTAAYTLPCGDSGGTCVPQLGTSQQLDTLGDRLMFRLAYRNFGDHEALVASHTVDVSGHTGIRWYELRPNGSHVLSIFQQGTYAPDASFRWMPSIAQDKAGNMALGYSLSSSSLHPEITVTGRLAGDAAGAMTQGETTIVAGGGSQTGNSLSRWGDYSDMTVDPTDDCTFWYTNEYIPSDGSFNWRTRIASFRFPSCTSSSNTVTVSVNATGTYGSNPNLTGLAPNNSAITYVPSSESGNVTGSLTCSTAATSSSPVSGSPYAISSCSGLADAGHTIVYDYAHSGYVVLSAGVVLTYAGPSAVKHGKTARLSATLTSASGSPVAGRKVKITLGHQSCSHVTQSTGKATCNITSVKASKGKHTVKMSFGGDPVNARDYAPGSATQVITVK